jgi:hypothetical protein
MRNIKEIWKELEQHPDFVTGTLWTKENVIDQLEDLEDEDLNRVVDILVEKNKKRFGNIIEQFEGNAYEYGCWTDDLDWIEEEKNKIFADDSE